MGGIYAMGETRIHCQFTLLMIVSALNGHPKPATDRHLKPANGGSTQDIGFDGVTSVNLSNVVSDDEQK
jgi:hypothetical protein